MDETRREIITIMRRYASWIKVPDEEFPMKDELRKIGVDSMSVLNIIFDLENTFEVNIPDSMLTEEVFRTPETIETAIRGMLGA